MGRSKFSEIFFRLKYAHDFFTFFLGFEDGGGNQTNDFYILILVPPSSSLSPPLGNGAYSTTAGPVADHLDRPKSAGATALHTVAKGGTNFFLPQ